MTEVDFIQVTWLRALKVWWSLLWRGVLLIFLAVAGTGFFLGSLMQLIRLKPEIIKTVCIISGFIISIPAGIAVTKFVLTTHYSDFKIALIAK